jgi:hypothetical protein
VRDYGLLTALLPKILGNIHTMFDKLPMVKPLITALLGVDPGEQMSSQLSQAFLWVHPTVLTLLWGMKSCTVRECPPEKSIGVRLISCCVFPCRVGKCFCGDDWLVDVRSYVLCRSAMRGI